MKKCIFLPLIGDYDYLHEPKVITPGWDYICFTDNHNLKSKHWEIRVIENKNNLDNVKLAKSITTLYHNFVEDYDLSISTGAQMQPTCNLDDFIYKFLPDDKDMSMANHPNRICIYREANKCISKRKDNPSIIKQQMDFYKKEGYPKDNGLIATGIMIRKHNRSYVEKHCELWWDQINKWSSRTQLSFNYILWKYNLIDINYFSYQIIRGEGNYFKKYKHKRGK